uniref:Uncharacterized protein n=1 Tax=Timema poppense TaxID=170557 RepID=A0A7R9DBH4_TIMPO|nr:unnamed protein product [Timema poppensis]
MIYRKISQTMLIVYVDANNIDEDFTGNSPGTGSFEEEERGKVNASKGIPCRQVTTGGEKDDSGHEVYDDIKIDNVSLKVVSLATGPDRRREGRRMTRVDRTDRSLKILSGRLHGAAPGQCSGRWEFGIAKTPIRSSVCEKRGSSTYTKWLVVRTRVAGIAGQLWAVGLKNGAEGAAKMVWKGRQDSVMDRQTGRARPLEHGDPRTPMAWQHRNINYHHQIGGYSDRPGMAVSPDEHLSYHSTRLEHFMGRRGLTKSLQYGAQGGRPSSSSTESSTTSSTTADHDTESQLHNNRHASRNATAA